MLWTDSQWIYRARYYIVRGLSGKSTANGSNYYVCLFFQRRDHCLLMMHYYSFLTYTLALLDFLAHCTPVRFVKKFLCACNQCQVALTWRLFNSNISVSAVVLTCPDIPLSFCLLQLCGRCTENTREKLQTVSTSWLCVSSTDSSFEM